MTRINWIGAATLVLAVSVLPEMSLARDLLGHVELAGKPVAGSKVALWRTAGKSAPARLGEASAAAPRQLQHDDENSATKASGIDHLIRRPGPGGAVALLGFLAQKTPSAVVINELTTVASGSTNAQFIDATALSGSEVGLRIAAGNVPSSSSPPARGQGRRPAPTARRRRRAQHPADLIAGASDSAMTHGAHS